MKTLLHACCGPCSLEPSRLLRAQGCEIDIYYANSNIAPEEEYHRRLATLRSWAKTEDLRVIEGNYDPAGWEKTAGSIGQAALDAASENIKIQDQIKKSDRHTAAQIGEETDGQESTPSLEQTALAIDPTAKKARCRACYRLRLRETAQVAAQGGYEAIATTLSVSPYQYTSLIKEELQDAANRAGIQALFEDFRPYYPQATKRSRELGMYRQNYCGCRFSDLEARAERKMRAEKRAAKKAARAEKRAIEEAALEKRRAERAAYEAKQARKHALLKAFRSR